MIVIAARTFWGLLRCTRLLEGGVVGPFNQELPLIPHVGPVGLQVRAGWDPCVSSQPRCEAQRMAVQRNLRTCTQLAPPQLVTSVLARVASTLSRRDGSGGGYSRAVPSKSTLRIHTAVSWKTAPPLG